MRFEIGAKVCTKDVEGFFLGLNEAGDALVLKRDYAFFGQFSHDENSEYVVTVAEQDLKEVDGGSFEIKGYHYHLSGGGVVIELDDADVLERLQNLGENSYFVMDNHTNHIYFCGLGGHVPVFLHIMKKHYGLKHVSREEIAAWSELVDTHFVFYNGKVHDASHYTAHLPRRFKKIEEQ